MTTTASQPGADAFAPSQIMHTALKSIPMMSELAEGGIGQKIASSASIATQSHSAELEAARLYEDELVPGMFQAWARMLVSTLSVKPGQTVLDAACGTGVVARLAAMQAGITGAVSGFDQSAAMIEVARRHAPPPTDLSAAPIEWHVADASSLPFADGSFDAVYCQFGVPYFAEPARALREIKRVLRPGGELAVSVWSAIEDNPAFDVVSRLLEKHAGAASAALVRAPYALHTWNAVERLLASSGFGNAVLQTRAALASFSSADAFLRACLSGARLSGHLIAMRAPARTALLDELRAELSRHSRNGRLCFPMQALIARGRK